MSLIISGNVPCIHSHRLYLIANQSVFSQVISLNENKTGFSATQVLLYLRNIIMIIIFTVIFKMSFSYDLYKSIFTEPPHNKPPLGLSGAF
jgi:hypothetical protein